MSRGCDDCHGGYYPNCPSCWTPGACSKCEDEPADECCVTECGEYMCPDCFDVYARTCFECDELSVEDLPSVATGNNSEHRLCPKCIPLWEANAPSTESMPNPLK